MTDTTDAARTALHHALAASGCADPSGVSEAIEALMDAKQDEGPIQPERFFSPQPGDRARHGKYSCEGYRGLCPTCSLSLRAAFSDVDPPPGAGPYPTRDAWANKTGPEACCAGGAVSRAPGSPCEGCPQRPGRAS